MSSADACVRIKIIAGSNSAVFPDAMCVLPGVRARNYFQRMVIIEHVKASDEYEDFLEAGDCEVVSSFFASPPCTPKESDMILSKRKFESVLRRWRRKLRVWSFVHRAQKEVAKELALRLENMYFFVKPAIVQDSK